MIWGLKYMRWGTLQDLWLLVWRRYDWEEKDENLLMQKKGFNKNYVDNFFSVSARTKQEIMILNSPTEDLA